MLISFLSPHKVTAEAKGLISTNARAESDAKASGYPMTVAGDVAEGASAAPSDPSRDGARAAGPRLGAMSDWAMRVPWLWPALLTAILGWYQLADPSCGGMSWPAGRSRPGRYRT